MTANHDPADWAPVHVHAPLTFDMSPEQPVVGPLGKSEVPVTILSPLRFDLGQPEDVPVLRLTLHLLPDADPAQLALDVLGLIDALNRYEQELGGRGVTWDKTQSRAEPQRGVVHLVLAPNNPSHAGERLAQLAAVATAATNTNPAPPAALTTKAPSFARWEATVSSDAA